MDLDIMNVENKMQKLTLTQGSTNNISNTNDDDIKVYPVGGLGASIDIIKKFEKRYRKKQIEYALYTNKKGEYRKTPSGKILVQEGTNESVPWTAENYAYFMSLNERLLCHNHPPNYEDEVNFTGRQSEIYGSFSSDDILLHIFTKQIETRVVDAKYTYVMQEPKIGWETWLQTYDISEPEKYISETYEVSDEGFAKYIRSYYKQVKSELYTKLKSAYETYDTGKNQYEIDDRIHGQITHGAVVEISKKFKIPYARYKWSGYKKYNY